MLSDPPAIVLDQVNPTSELPGSPRLPAGVPGVAVAVVPAEAKKKVTLAALGAVNMTRRQSLLYGADGDQVLRLVAFDARTGRVFHSNIAGAHAPGLGPMKKFNPAEPPAAPSGAKLPTGFGFNFAVDLPSRLNLPSDAASYTVFAWMEDLASQPTPVDVPEDKTRSPAKPFLPEPSITSPVSVRKSDLSPPRKKEEIGVRAAPPAEEPTKRMGRVLVTIGPGVLPAVAPGTAVAPKYVAILAQTALDRTVAVRTIMLPPAVFDETGCGEFDFEVTDIFPAQTKRQPAFVVIVAGKVVSKAIVIMPPEWSE